MSIRYKFVNRILQAWAYVTNRLPKIVAETWLKCN